MLKSWESNNVESKFDIRYEDPNSGHMRAQTLHPDALQEGSQCSPITLRSAYSSLHELQGSEFSI